MPGTNKLLFYSTFELIKSLSMNKITLWVGMFLLALLFPLINSFAQTELKILSEPSTRIIDVNNFGIGVSFSQYYNFNDNSLTMKESAAARLNAINNQGDVAGLYHDSVGIQVGYKLSGEEWQGAGGIEGVSENQVFYTSGISQNGKYITGMVSIGSVLDMLTAGFIFDTETQEMTPVYDPQGEEVLLISVNNNGIAAGWVYKSGEMGITRVPAYWTPNGELYSFPEGNPEWAFSVLNGINNNNVMVGDYNGQPFIYDLETDTSTLLDIPQGADSAAFADISDTGIAIGYTNYDMEDRDAIIYDPTRFGSQPVYLKDVLSDLGVNINTIDGKMGTAVRISDNGKYISGWVNGQPGNEEGWILFLDNEDDEQPGTNPEDCNQGNESNDFENGNQVGANTGVGAADDFMVSAGNTLNIKTITLNLIAYEPIASVDLKFYEDDNGTPGDEYISVEGLTPDTDHQVPVGNAFGINVYSVYLDVDLDFEGGDSGAVYWMQPIATANGVIASVFWETTTAPGGLGNSLRFYQNSDVWDEDLNKNAVFTLYCETTSPGEQPVTDCLTFSGEILPITRFVFEGIDNTTSETSEEAVEYFTEMSATIAQGNEYSIIIEGVTNGESSGFITLFVDMSEEDQDAWTVFQAFQIGEIFNSNGTDGMQLTGSLTLPEDFPDGTYTMRILSIYGDYPIVPCGNYAMGQAEDYTLIVDSSLSVKNREFNNFTFFPNPVKDQINLQAGTEIENITLFNLLGQKVMDVQPGRMNTQIDLNHLSSGVYLMKVNLNGVEKTYKIVKE